MDDQCDPVVTAAVPGPGVDVAMQIGFESANRVTEEHDDSFACLTAIPPRMTIILGRVAVRTHWQYQNTTINA